MDILTNYRNKIKSLSEELIHCIEQYNIILKEIENANNPKIDKTSGWIIDAKGRWWTAVDDSDV